MTFNNRIFKFLAILFIFIITLHITASYLYLYWRILWFDNVMHFIGGAWLAFFLLWLFYFSGVLTVPSSPAFFVLLVVLGFVALGGVLWEFSEFLIDIFFEKEWFGQSGVSDTMSDLFFDLLGGTAAAAIFIYKSKLRNERRFKE